MDSCSRNPNRTAPVGEDALQRLDVPLCSRTNGWSWPPHPFQLLAWLLYVFFAVTGFGVLVPLLPTYWIPAGYICTGIIFVYHLSVHVLAVSVDPSDYSVRTKSNRGPVPTFDRSKHAHVIENCHCYLCQVDVGPKSKHCSTCNKCVANFDHHCRWLNNCVGSRNYRLFLHSVVSALLGVGLVLVFASYVFIEFFLDPSKLRTDKHFLVRNETGVWFLFLPVAPLRSAAAVIPALAAVTVALGLLSSVLLCHLLCFHIYLMWNRLSTYEYIVRQRHRLGSRDPRKSGSEKEAAAPSVLKDLNSGTLGYTNPQLDLEEPPAHTEFLANGTVRSVSSPVMREEGPPTISAEQKAAAAHTHRHTQKKKKKGRRVPAQVTRENHLSGAPPPAEPSGVATASQAQRLPFPAFPLRASLPPLAPTSGPVQAAAPPAEYHSDSAESLEEIPVALAKLGSSAAAGDGSTSSHRDVPAFPLPSPHPRTKRKASSFRAHRSAAELRFQMASAQLPSVFVSRASGEASQPQEDGLPLGLRPPGCRPGSRPASRTSLGSGGASWVQQ
ncbi:palmitoyltransferase ZDHHC1 isoform 2-T2 [Odontesthes bonariensis]|uniref:palmitoyltransferase ZDHHC1 isoform X2 n=1 Tax=Odontesthes bonariensis TaxID=219752 RepID=UPI003F587264